MSALPGPSAATKAPKMKTFSDDHIVRYTLAHEVPIVGLVRDRREEREMREMALIAGTILALPKPKRLDA